MQLSKKSTILVDIFVKNLKKKEKEIDVHTLDVSTHFNAMVSIKDHLGTVYNNDNIAVNERTKIFMTELKKLENIGEKHDTCIKKIKDLKEKINLEIEILITNIKQIDNTESDDQIRNHIFQYIESKR